MLHAKVQVLPLFSLNMCILHKPGILQRPLNKLHYFLSLVNGHCIEWRKIWLQNFFKKLSILPTFDTKFSKFWKFFIFLVLIRFRFWFWFQKCLTWPVWTNKCKNGTFPTSTTYFAHFSWIIWKCNLECTLTKGCDFASIAHILKILFFW